MDIWPTPLQIQVITAIMEGLEDYYGRYADTRYHLGWRRYKSYTHGRLIRTTSVPHSVSA